MKIAEGILPAGWIGLSLEEVAEIHDNLREPVNSSERAKRPGTYPYYGATGQVGWIDDFRQDGEYVLLGEDGAPFFEPTKEKAYLVSGKCWVNNHAHVLKGREGLCSNRYLLYALNQTNYRGYANGTTRLKLTQSAMRQLPINLAPFLEQHRIVAKIEELFSELEKGIENLKTARAQLKVYRQALLKHAFEGKLTVQWRAENQDKLETAEALLKRIQQERAQRYQQQLADWEASGKQGSKPKAPKHLPPLTAEELAELPELPEGWGWVRIFDLIVDSTLGLDRGSQYQNPEPPGLPYIKMNNVTMDGRVTADKLVYVDVDETEQERYVLREGDILFNTRNSKELVGKTGLVRKFVVPTVYNNNLMRIRLHDGISPYFVCHQMCSAGFKQKLEKAKKGTTNVAAVYAKDLFPLLLVLAPQLEQQRIVELVEAQLSEADQLDQTIITSLQQAEALRQSILKKAFSGQLVAQDPHDEPASVLLARIRAERESVVTPKRNKRNS